MKEKRFVFIQGYGHSSARGTVEPHAVTDPESYDDRPLHVYGTIFEVRPGEEPPKPPYRACLILPVRGKDPAGVRPAELSARDREWGVSGSFEFGKKVRDVAIRVPR